MLQDSKELQDKVIIITGGSRGIGRHLVIGAARQGARIVFCARHVEESDTAVQAEAEAYREAGRILAVRADISQEKDVEDLFARTLDTFGSVDAVVNNAGISRAHLLLNLPTTDWDEVIGVNLTGTYLVSREAVRCFLRQKRGGQIISIGSLTQHGAPSNAAYAASKGGLLGLTRCIAREYGRHGISANLVIGGYVKTELLHDVPESLLDLLRQLCPQKRHASGDEIASVVLHLLSSGGMHLNGQSIYVTGGLIEAPAYISGSTKQTRERLRGTL